MKVILEYGDEEQAEVELALNAGKFAAALNDIDNFARSQLKYGLTLDAEAILEHIRSLIPEESR